MHDLPPERLNLASLLQWLQKWEQIVLRDAKTAPVVDFINRCQLFFGKRVPTTSKQTKEFLWNTEVCSTSVLFHGVSKSDEADSPEVQVQQSSIFTTFKITLSNIWLVSQCRLLLTLCYIVPAFGLTRSTKIAPVQVRCYSGLNSSCFHDECGCGVLAGRLEGFEDKAAHAL